MQRLAIGRECEEEWEQALQQAERRAIRKHLGPDLRAALRGIRNGRLADREEIERLRANVRRALSPIRNLPHEQRAEIRVLDLPKCKTSIAKAVADRYRISLRTVCECRNEYRTLMARLGEP